MARAHALIIEDSSTARIILARLLERSDISSKGVATAEEAFSLLQHESYDVIFLDHLLPGMNGFQALEQLKGQSHTCDIPVFMYTSQNAEKYIEEARALGAAGVIRKQIDREQLQRTLDTLLINSPEPEYSEALRAAVEASALTGKDNPEQTARRLTGRMSTLEVAYEELEEELRETRDLITQIQQQNSERLNRQRQSIRGLATLGVLLLVALVWISTWQAGVLDSHIQRTNDQFELMQSIVGSVIELFGR
ncbi:MAG: Response regulator containing a CheY-like receiver domain and a GGDEF domain [Marinobacter excellens HL-55]|uniref:Response regulator containing a CheY-like receiver domain and a GGDEF domain n=1 Tax=Marinobacter excellens HL-55 TaxID=1305731 RepID=A0A0P7Z8H4_9GAMM|nr:MAG: Response regulator containing a CheY-like receiver domain and a GGDEF domain [Marinobacter excellens HL-55]